MGKKKIDNYNSRSLTTYRTAVSAVLHLARINHHIFQFIYQPYPKYCKPEHYEKAQTFFTTALVAARVYVYKDGQTKEPMIVPPDWISISGDVTTYSKIHMDRMPDIKELVCYGEKMFNDKHFHIPLAPAIYALRKFMFWSDNADQFSRKKYKTVHDSDDPWNKGKELDDFERDFIDALKIDLTPFANLTEAFLLEYYKEDYKDQPIT